MQSDIELYFDRLLKVLLVIEERLTEILEELKTKKEGSPRKAGFSGGERRGVSKRRGVNADTIAPRLGGSKAPAPIIKKSGEGGSPKGKASGAPVKGVRIPPAAMKEGGR